MRTIEQVIFELRLVSSKSDVTILREDADIIIDYFDRMMALAGPPEGAMRTACTRQ